MDVLELTFGLAVGALGAVLVALRERLGAQARTQGHGVTPLLYGVIGVVLVASGAIALVAGLG